MRKRIKLNTLLYMKVLVISLSFIAIISNIISHQINKKISKLMQRINKIVLYFMHFTYIKDRNRFYYQS